MPNERKSIKVKHEKAAVVEADSNLETQIHWRRARHLSCVAVKLNQKHRRIHTYILLWLFLIPLYESIDQFDQVSYTRAMASKTEDAGVELTEDDLDLKELEMELDEDDYAYEEVEIER